MDRKTAIRPSSRSRNRSGGAESARHFGHFQNAGFSRRPAGGAEGIRTPDLCSAIAALSHLSYSPGLAGHLGGGSTPVNCDPGRCRAEDRLRMRSLLWLIDTVITLYVWLLIASAVLSWLIAFNVVNTRNPIVAQVADFLDRVTEPALRPIRRILPNLGGIDVSPIILILLLYFLRNLIFEIFGSVGVARI